MHTGLVMRSDSKPLWRHVLTPLAIAGLLLSLVTLCLKIDFWGGTRYAPFYLKVGIWFVIVAGPLALWQRRRRPFISLALVTVEFLLITLAVLQ